MVVYMLKNNSKFGFNFKLQTMKSLACLLSFLFIAQFGFSQHTLTRANSVPVVGDTFYYKTASDTIFNVSSGANQVWDFSNLDSSGKKSAEVFMAPANASNVKDYSNVTMVQGAYGIDKQGKLSLFQEHFYKTTPTQIEVLGHYSKSSFKYVYNESRVDLKFPFTYNSIYKDSAKFKWYDPFDRTNPKDTNWMLSKVYEGEVMVKGLGYGKLKTPYAVFDSTLLIRRTLRYHFDPSPNNGFTWVEFDTTYLWYSSKARNYIAVTRTNCMTIKNPNPSVLDSNCGSANKRPKYLSYLIYNTKINTATELVLSQKASYKLFPNPAKNLLTIKNLQPNDKIELLNIAGKVQEVEISKLNTEAQLNIATLPAGMYIVAIKNAENTHYERFVKE